MLHRTLIICLACCCALASQGRPASCSAQVLQSLREDVREPDEEKPQEPEKKSKNNTRISFFGDGFGEALLAGAALPYWGPIVALHDYYCLPGYFA